MFATSFFPCEVVVVPPKDQLSIIMARITYIIKEKLQTSLVLVHPPLILRLKKKKKSKSLIEEQYKHNFYSFL